MTYPEIFNILLKYNCNNVMFSYNNSNNLRQIDYVREAIDNNQIKFWWSSSVGDEQFCFYINYELSNIYNLSDLEKYVKFKAFR